VAGPLVVPIAELRRRVGTRRPLQREVDVAAVHDLASDDGVAGTIVPPGGAIDVDLVVESVLEGVTVTGTLRAPWRAECRRCLETVEGEAEIEVQELFEASPTPGETYPLDGDQIDLEPLVRDAVLLGLPLSVLCSETCAGPDPERFPAQVEGADPEDGAEDEAEHEADSGAAGSTERGEGEAEPPGDPRWAALRELRFDD
jgi:uncharacterized protein